jgi:hypothetical protein
MGDNAGEQMKLTDRMLQYIAVYPSITFRDLKQICPDKPRTITEGENEQTRVEELNTSA